MIYAMVNKEIPFVVVSSVNERLNCITVKEATEDENKLEKVYALDTHGGAIKAEYVGEINNVKEIFPKFE